VFFGTTVGIWLTICAVTFVVIREGTVVSPHVGCALFAAAGSDTVGTAAVTVRLRAAWSSSAREIAEVIRGRTWFCAAAGTTARRKGKAKKSFFMATLKSTRLRPIRRRATISNQLPAGIAGFSKWINDESHEISEKDLSRGKTPR